MTPPESPDLHILSVLNRLENADKHQNLIPVTVALTDVISMIQRGTQMRPGNVMALCRDGAVVADFAFPPRDIPPESEVKVHVDGTPKIAVRIREPDGYAEVLPALRKLVEKIPRDLFTNLEPFVRT